jgi:hypothetical protein
VNYVNINLITGSAGSQTVTVDNDVTDLNLNNCTYSILNMSDSVNGLNTNVSFTCNSDFQATVTEYGTYNMFIYSRDKANNLNYTNLTFTVSQATLVQGGGGGSIDKIPVIALVSVNSSKTYSELQLAIIYANLNNYCSDKLRKGTFAVVDYSDTCTLNQVDLNKVLLELKEDSIELSLDEVTKFYQNYKKLRLFQAYVSENEVNKYSLLTSVLGLTQLLVCSPPSIDSPVVINANGGYAVKNYTLFCNKAIKSCETVIVNFKCTPKNSTVLISLDYPETKFFNKIFQGVLTLTTDASSDQVEVKKIPVTFRTYNIGYRLLGIPVYIFFIVGVAGISILGFNYYKKKRTKKLNIGKDLLKLG